MLARLHSASPGLPHPVQEVIVEPDGSFFGDVAHVAGVTLGLQKLLDRGRGRTNPCKACSRATPVKARNGHAVSRECMIASK
jgi:hypothetical protein